MTRVSDSSLPSARVHPVPAPRRFSDRVHLLPRGPGSLLCLLLVLLMLGPDRAQAQNGRTAAPVNDQCRTEYSKAEDLYLSAEFDPAIRLLQTCIDETQSILSDTTKIQMYRLLAFSHLGLGDDNGARKAVTSLLAVAPAYRPNPTQDRPDFVQMVQQVREERRSMAASEDRGRNWVNWVVGGVGVVALGVLAAVLSGGGGGDD